VQCPNVCAAQESERQAWIKNIAAVFAVGIAKREELAAEGQALFENATAGLPGLKELVNELEANRTRVEDEGRRKKNPPTEEVSAEETPVPAETGEDSTPTPTPTPDENELFEDPINADLEDESPIKEPEPEADEGPAEGDEVPEPPEPPVGSGPDEESDSEEDFERYEPPATPSPPPTPTPEPKSIYGDLRPWQQFLVKVWQFTFRVPDRSPPEPAPEPPSHGYHYEPPWDSETQAQLDVINNELTARREELERAEKIVKFTGEDPAYRSLFGKEFKQNGYTLIFMQEFKQDWTNLGRYNRIEGRTMHLDNGDYCWQIKKGRESTIDLACGNESRLVDITEGSTCSYRATFATPAACSQTDIDDLARLTLLELQTLAERAGIVAKA
jgi:hypothetical protein